MWDLVIDAPVVDVGNPLGGAEYEFHRCNEGDDGVGLAIRARVDYHQQL